MRLTEPRINPVEESDWTESQRALLAPQVMRGRVQNIFLTLANHEALAKRWMVFANHILHKSKLSPRDREILILRVGWLCQSGYEWGQHVLIGQKAG
ncbi:MAG TPA: carboxymuconolactone decarboxylase family protein, partial [Gammaproteobacteria bacterium]|nr:carboxymuconolactone decarboxylase family protein [Gammaproteobacteria bacterium]